MDPLSMAFGAYINYVSVSVHEEITDLIGTEVTAVSIQHKGLVVPFHHQLWRVRDQSVCYTYTNNIQDFSKCTIAAKQLFADLCFELQQKPELGWRYKKTKNMYCYAAASFKPTIASIAEGTVESEVQLARKKCNVATAIALGSNDVSLHKNKNEACDDYQRFK